MYVELSFWVRLYFLSKKLETLINLGYAHICLRRKRGGQREEEE